MFGLSQKEQQAEAVLANVRRIIGNNEATAVELDQELSKIASFEDIHAQAAAKFQQQHEAEIEAVNATLTQVNAELYDAKLNLEAAQDSANQALATKEAELNALAAQVAEEKAKVAAVSKQLAEMRVAAQADTGAADSGLPKPAGKVMTIVGAIEAGDTWSDLRGGN